MRSLEIFNNYWFEVLKFNEIKNLLEINSNKTYQLKSPE